MVSNFIFQALEGSKPILTHAGRAIDFTLPCQMAILIFVKHCPLTTRRRLLSIFYCYATAHDNMVKALPNN